MEPEEIEEIRTRQKFMIELATALYDKSIAYTNLILVAGYAAFLTVWSNSKPYLSECEARASVALILLSLLFFVLWELYKMVLTGTAQQRHARVISASPETFWAEMENLKDAERSLLVRAIRAWPVVLALTIVPGVLAAGVLMWGLVTHGMF